MRLNLEALLILDALDRHGTFAAAAARLFKTASALSYTVQKMESDLKITLLDRSGHRATFTPTGRLMLEKGRTLLRAVAAGALRGERLGESADHQRGCFAAVQHPHAAD
ncbi:hypothetical protein E05_44120 [Plautia stali symbiont]|nr:hypothetical protein E05_44120 [Plautia stali symbiont]